MASSGVPSTSSGVGQPPLAKRLKLQCGDVGSMTTYCQFLQSADVLSVIEWCRDHGLLAREYICPTCKRPMILSPRKGLGDQYSWVCRQYGGNAHHVKRSIRSGTWFEDSNLSIATILAFTFMWCAEMKVGFICEQLDVASATAADWGSFCREVCQDILIGQSGKIGGPGMTVEIEESKFNKKKFSRGKEVKGKWVFGGVEWGFANSFFTVVENRNSETLLSVIQENVLPGTEIVSDCWKAYDCLSNEGFKRLTVNHTYTFKDPDTGAHTNGFEGPWSAIKRKLKTRQTDLFDHYWAEYVWRQKVCKDKSMNIKMASLLEMIALAYPPRSKDE